MQLLKAFLLLSSVFTSLALGQTDRAAPVDTKTFREPQQPLPASGRTSFIENREPVAPLTILSEGSSHHFVKMVDSISGKDVMVFFVRAGTRVEVRVPEGTFEMKYASGEKWYGEKHLFGPETSYTRADKLFHFGEEVSESAKSRIEQLSEDLVAADLKLRDFMSRNGFTTSTLDTIFEETDSHTGRAGADRMDAAWWQSNVLSQFDDPSTYNRLVDLLNARNQISNALSALRAREVKIAGYSVTLYAVPDGNMSTTQISASDF
jgi:hypothetical protein